MSRKKELNEMEASKVPDKVLKQWLMETSRKLEPQGS